MVKNSGGYAIVSHDDIDIYSKVKGAFENHKPILFYDDDNTCYFIDTIKYGDDDDLIITKGGKTFTVTTNNTLSSEGEIQVESKKLYRHLITLKTSTILGFNVEIICSIAESIVKEDLSLFLKDLGYDISNNNDCLAIGTGHSSTKVYVGIGYVTQFGNPAIQLNESDLSEATTIVANDITYFKDTVKEL